MAVWRKWRFGGNGGLAEMAVWRKWRFGGNGGLAEMSEKILLLVFQ
jgi:hypothetical protein